MTHDELEKRLVQVSLTGSKFAKRGSGHPLGDSHRQMKKKKNLSHFLDKTQGWERKESNISNIFSHGHPNLIRREGLKRGMSQISDQRNSLMVMASEEREGYVIFWHTSAHSSLQNSFVCNQFFIRFLIIQQMKDLYQLAGFG